MHECVDDTDFQQCFNVIEHNKRQKIAAYPLDLAKACLQAENL